MRLDAYLTEHGLCEAVKKAKAVIMAGCVFVNNQNATGERPSSPMTRSRSERGNAFRQPRWL